LLAIHLDGAFLTTRAALRQMYKQGSGSIIYMGSVHSKEASVLKAPYVTAKHGLLGLARVVAKEGAEHGVRANVICPGTIDTPMPRALPGRSEAHVQATLRANPLGRVAQPQDVADLILFLLSRRSSHITGQVLAPNGGQVTL
jgi:3-hydroxybutyrate dehydrogenase